MKISLACLYLPALLLFSCNQASQSDRSDRKDNQASVAEVQIKDESLQSVFTNYLKVKDALVASDVAKVQAASAELNDALSSVEGCENTAGIAQKVAASKDIDEQRTLFTLLTSDIIPVFKEAEITSGSIFMQFCPMANNGDGGYWLAKEDHIRNPYYGDKMLKCGKVVEEFKQGSD